MKDYIKSAAILYAESVPKDEMVEGFWRQTLVHTEDLMLCLFTWRRGAILPPHSHPHRQAGYVISGSVELTVSGRKYITSTGCSYLIEADEPHSARAVEDSLVLDAFTPLREEYLPATSQ